MIEIPGLVQLQVPARPSYLALARMVVGGLAVAAGVSLERSQDLRLALTEGATAAIEDAERSGDVMHVRAREGIDLFEVVLETDSPALRRIAADPVRWPLIEALSDRARVGGDGRRVELALGFQPTGGEDVSAGPAIDAVETGAASSPAPGSGGSGAAVPPESAEATWWDRPAPIEADAGAAGRDGVTPGERVLLRLPAEPGSVAVARLAASAVASRMSFTFDEVEDLRIAVSELCSVLLSAPGDDGFLDLEYLAGAGELEVTGRGGEPSGGLSGLSEQILSCLADAYETGASPDGRGFFRLTKRHEAD